MLKKGWLSFISLEDKMKTKRRNGFIRRLSAVCIIGIALLFAFSACDDGGGGNGGDGDTASFAGTWNGSGGR
jgi:hypothetical protein